MILPYSRQSIGEDDIREVVKALRASYITQGPRIEAFEKLLARHCRTKYAIAFSNGTTALHAAYAAAGVGKGDEVIMPALTFAATANAALYLGAKPVFVDIDEQSATMDVRDAERKITKRTKAIVPVDYAGRPAELSQVRAIAKKHGLVFIEDGAQSLGATYRGRAVGAKADMTIFSFHPVKSITTGEGGAIVTNNKKYYEYLRMFRTHGFTKDPKKFKDNTKAAWHQEMHILGNNYRITDIQAALGISQMKKLNRFVTLRRKAAARYVPLLRDIRDVVLPSIDVLKSSAWHLFVIRIPASVRDVVFAELRAKGIGVQVHYLPVYLHPYYRSLGYREGLCPKTESFASSAISIPLFPGILKKEQLFVANTLRDILRKHV